jgi:hypothetical protein
MDTLPFECLLEFAAGWRPPRNEFEQARSYWQTWAQFMSTWLQVREEYLAREQWGSGDIFAEQVYKVYGAKGPSAGTTSDEVRAAIEAAQDAAAGELLADVRI